MFMPTKKKGVRRATSGSARSSRSTSSSSLSNASTIQTTTTAATTSSSSSIEASSAAQGQLLRSRSDASLNFDSSATAPTDTLASCEQNRDTDGFAQALEQSLGSLRKMELRGRNSTSLFQRLKEITSNTPSSLLGSDQVVNSLVMQLDEISLKPMPSARLPTLHPSLTCNLLTTALQSSISTASRLRITLSYLIDLTGRRAWIDDSECNSLTGRIARYILEIPDSEMSTHIEEVIILVLQAKEICNGSEKCSDSIASLISNSHVAKIVDLSVLKKLLKGNLKNVLIAISQLLSFDSVRLYTSHKLNSWAQTAGVEHLAYSLLKKLLKKETESPDPEFAIVRALFRGCMALKENKEEILTLFFDACVKSTEWLRLVGAFALENDARFLPVVLQTASAHVNELDKQLQGITRTLTLSDENGLFQVKSDVFSSIQEAKSTESSTYTGQVAVSRSSLISYTFGLIWLDFFQIWSLSRVLDYCSWSDIYHRMYQGKEVVQQQIEDFLFGDQDLEKDRTYIQGLFQSSLCYVSNYTTMLGIDKPEGLDSKTLSLVLASGTTAAPISPQVVRALARAECLFRQSLKHSWTLPLTVYNELQSSTAEDGFHAKALRFHSAINHYTYYKSAILQHDVLHSLRGLVAIEDLKYRGKQIQEDVHDVVHQFDNLSAALREPKLSILAHCFIPEEQSETYEDSALLIRAITENRVDFLLNARSWDLAFPRQDLLCTLRFVSDLTSIPITSVFILPSAVHFDATDESLAHSDSLKQAFWVLVHKNVILHQQLQNSVSFDETNPLQPFFEMTKVGETLPGNSTVLAEALLRTLFYDPELANSRPDIVEYSLRNVGRYIVRTSNSIDYVYRKSTDTAEITEWVRSLTDGMNNLSRISRNKAVTDALTAWICCCFQEQQPSETWFDFHNYLYVIDQPKMCWLNESEVLNRLSDCFALLWICACPNHFSVHFWKNDAVISELKYSHTKKSILLSIVTAMYYTSGAQIYNEGSAWRQICSAVQAHFQLSDELWNDIFSRGMGTSLILDELRTSGLDLGRLLREQRDPAVFEEFLTEVATQLLHDGKALQEPPEWLQRLLSHDHSLYTKLPSFTLSYLAFCSASKILSEDFGMEKLDDVCESCSHSSQKLSRLSHAEFCDYSGRILQIAADFLCQGQAQRLLKVIMCHSLLNRIFNRFSRYNRQLQYFGWFQWTLTVSHEQSLLPHSFAVVRTTADELIKALPLKSRGDMLRDLAAIKPFSSLWASPFSMKIFIIETLVAILVLATKNEDQMEELTRLAYRLFKLMCRVSNEVVEDLLSSVTLMQMSQTGDTLKLMEPALRYWVDKVLPYNGKPGRKELNVLRECCSRYGVSVSLESSGVYLPKTETPKQQTDDLRGVLNSSLYSDFRKPLHWLIHSDSKILRTIRVAENLNANDIATRLKENHNFPLTPEKSTASKDSSLLYDVCLNFWKLLVRRQQESWMYHVTYVVLERLGTTAVELCKHRWNWVRHVREHKHDVELQESQLYDCFLGVTEFLFSQAPCVLGRADCQTLANSLRCQIDKLPVHSEELQAVRMAIDPSNQLNGFSDGTMSWSPVRLFQEAYHVGDSVETRLRVSKALDRTRDPHLSRAILMCYLKTLRHAISGHSEHVGDEGENCSLFLRSRLGLLPNCITGASSIRPESYSSRDSPRRRLEKMKNGGSLKTIMELLSSCISMGPHLFLHDPRLAKEVLAILWKILELLASSTPLFGYASFLDGFAVLIDTLLNDEETSARVCNLLQYGNAHDKTLTVVVQKYSFIKRLKFVSTKLNGMTTFSSDNEPSIDLSLLEEFRDKLIKGLAFLQRRSVQTSPPSSEMDLSTSMLLARRCIFHTHERHCTKPSSTTLRSKANSSDIDNDRKLEERPDTKKQDTRGWRENFRGMAQSAAEVIMASMEREHINESSVGGSTEKNASSLSSADDKSSSADYSGDSVSGYPQPSCDATVGDNSGDVPASAVKYPTFSADISMTVPEVSNEGSVGQQLFQDPEARQHQEEASDLAISRSVYGMLMKSSCDLLDIRLPRSMFNDLESASRLCYSTLPTDVQVGECVKDSETPPYQTEIPLSIADFENDTGLKKVLSATYSENSQVPPEENDEDFLAHELVGKRRKLESREGLLKPLLQPSVDALPHGVESQTDILTILQQLIHFVVRAGALSKIDPNFMHAKFLEEEELLAPSAIDPWADILHSLWPSLSSICQFGSSMDRHCRHTLLGLLQMIAVSTPRTVQGDYMLQETKTAIRTVLTADNEINVTSELTIQELREWNEFLRVLDM